MQGIQIQCACPVIQDIVDLNPHINYNVTPGPQSDIDDSLSQPGGLAFAANGGTIYVSALGSAKIGVLDAGGSVVARIQVGAGPSGLALDESRHRVYVLERFANTVSVVDTDTPQVASTVTLSDPSPLVIKNARRFLYDAFATSGNGEASCSSCHVFGDIDSLVVPGEDRQRPVQLRQAADEPTMSLLARIGPRRWRKPGAWVAR